MASAAPSSPAPAVARPAPRDDARLGVRALLADQEGFAALDDSTRRALAGGLARIGSAALANEDAGAAMGAAAGAGAGAERRRRILRRRRGQGRRHDQGDPQRGLLPALRHRADHRRLQGDERFEPAAADRLRRPDPQRRPDHRGIRRFQRRRLRRPRLARRAFSRLLHDRGRRRGRASRRICRVSIRRSGASARPRSRPSATPPRGW